MVFVKVMNKSILELQDKVVTYIGARNVILNTGNKIYP